MSSSSPILWNPNTTHITGAPAPQAEVGSSVATMQKCLVFHGRHHKRSAQCALFQDGDRDEDCDLPTKRFKILKTTWNCTQSNSGGANYVNERMLELSRVTCRAISARMQYQCIHSHELDLMKSILEDETTQSQQDIHSLDLQIGSLRHMLHAGRVTVIGIGHKGCKLDPNDHDQACRSACESGLLVIRVAALRHCSVTQDPSGATDKHPQPRFDSPQRQHRGY
ncbi:uncharacterized protein F5891DRAFT_978713 [Suillus fuscotomentosus]|uniref:Uncharacterized protein n=1 Tax=Suillus fuscotomentosus TaxID=1912939 RepID=A0AAD4HMS8_9AGAM|nr:uncharacterized protein F5891DRAFT_978713 [Suillus fuscotomentosus]KAG1902398.1 hypothetical protein F5891DRAFT_978713 [Suillus fuscotomentosus]